MNSKRLLILITGLLLLVPVLAWGQVDPRDSMIVESKTVAPQIGPTNAEPVMRVKVSITNKDSLTAWTIAMNENTIAGTAYGTLGRSAGGTGARIFSSVISFLTTTLPNGAPFNATAYNSTSPDIFSTGSFFSAGDDASKEPPNATRKAMFEIKFDSVTGLGQFRLDSTTQLANKCRLNRVPAGAAVNVNYVPGVITVAVPPPVINCRDTAILYGRSLSMDFNATGTGTIVWSMCGGPGSIDPVSGLFTFAGQCGLGPIPFCVRATDGLGQPTDCNFTVTVIDNAPSCSPLLGTVTVSHGALATNTINTSDPDAGDIVLVAQQSGPGSVTPAGAWSYLTGCSDVGLSPQTAQFQVRDSFPGCAGHLTRTCSFQLVVTNADPTIQCPPDAQIQSGDSYGPVCPTAGDIDPADAGSLAFSGIAVPPLTGFAVDPGTGCVTAGPVTPADAGPHVITLTVTDLCGRTATCDYTINVVVGAKFRICIDTIRAYQGTDVEVGINNTQDASDPDLANGKSVGGFSFLISYDCACLQFLSAKKGTLLNTQGWEFFTYRFGAVGNGNCGSGCPSCLLRVVAIADVNNGGNHPNLTRVNLGQWVVLKFRVTNDRTIAGQCCPISWFWFDCTDNTVSDSTGNVLWVVDSVYTASGAPIDLATEYPNDVSECDDFSGGPDKPRPKKRLIFCNGAICVPTPEEIDDRGDLNLNGIGYEIADAVLYENFFIYGSSVLSPIPQFRQSQIAASDVNGDGNPLSVGDLVALIRVITGDAFPLPKAIPGAAVAIAMNSAGSNVTLEANSISDLGGLHLTFKVNGTVGGVTLSQAAEGMTVQTNVNGDELSVLIFSDKKDVKIAPNAGAILSMNVDGSIDLVGSEAADYYGAVLPTLAKGPVVPTAFGLAQNYPNPFNAKTNIQLALPVTSDYTVTVYNVAGQVVKSFSGNAAAGTKTIVWDGTDKNGTSVSSGIYFYKAVAGKFSATKKMLLLQ